MPFFANLDNVPVLMVANDDNTGFYLATMQTVGIRRFRLQWSTVDDFSRPVECFYFFSADFSSFPLLTPVIVKLPFTKAKFVYDKNTTADSLSTTAVFDDIMQLQTAKGDKMSAGVFKLYTLDNTPSNVGLANAVSQEIDLKATYQVGNKFVRFVYYRKLIGNDGKPYAFYTGVLGDKAFENEYTSWPDLPTTDAIVQTSTVGGIVYFFMQLTSSPNVIIVNGIATAGSRVTDTYVDDRYAYTMVSSSSQLLQGMQARFLLTIRTLVGNNVVVPHKLASNSAYVKVTSIDSDDSSVLNVGVLVDKSAPASLDVRLFIVD